jgi:hypothetical protein
LSEKMPSEHPRLRRKPFWYSTPTFASRRASLDSTMKATTLAIASSSMMPRQLDGSERSPFFGRSVSRPTRHYSKHAVLERKKSRMHVCTAASVSASSACPRVL